MLTRVGAINPYSAVSPSVPACKHFFKCLDTDGVPRDSIGNVSIPSGATLTYASGPAGSPGVLTQTFNATLKALENNVNPYPNLQQVDYVPSSGTWNTFGSAGVVLMVWAARVRNPYIARVTIGSPGVVGGSGIATPIGSCYPDAALYGAGQDLHAVVGVNGSAATIGATGAYAIRADGGTGYPNGTINAVFTNGTTGSGAAGYFTVVGGVIVTYTPTNYGSGYPATSVDPVVLGTVVPAIGTAGTPASYNVNTLLQPTGGLLPTDINKDVISAIAFTPGSAPMWKILNALDSSGLITNMGAGVANSATTAFTPTSLIKISGLSLYGLAIFEFTSLPANWIVGSQWMGNQWTKGNRVLYPAWSGLS